MHAKTHFLSGIYLCLSRYLKLHFFRIDLVFVYISVYILLLYCIVYILVLYYLKRLVRSLVYLPFYYRS